MSLPPQQPQQATESTQEYHFLASKRAEIVNENLASPRREGHTTISYTSVSRSRDNHQRTSEEEDLVDFVNILKVPIKLNHF